MSKEKSQPPKPPAQPSGEKLQVREGAVKGNTLPTFLNPPPPPPKKGS